MTNLASNNALQDQTSGVETIAGDNVFFKRMLSFIPPHILSQDQQNQQTEEDGSGKCFL